MKYDPLRSPEPATWLAAEEDERLTAVLDYHKCQRVALPNALLHAAIHTVVENQCAMGEELPVQGKLEQLVAGGLDRHEAIHAVGSVLAAHFHQQMQNRTAPAPPKAYFEELEKLTAASWRGSAPDNATPN